MYAVVWAETIAADANIDDGSNADIVRGLLAAGYDGVFVSGLAGDSVPREAGDGEWSRNERDCQPLTICFCFRCLR